ncbi:MAG: DeoR/GlpR family DNA-binding transcription regulator [Bacillota bacterium]
MFAPERVRIIKSILLDKKHINVSDLSSMLNVSEVTIRRDLEKLEKEKFLTRTHGGAILNDSPEVMEDSANDILDDPFKSERLEISEIAFHMIDDNDIIMLTPGLTNLCIAKKILNKRYVTVLTNDLKIADELSANPGIKVIIPGGDLEPASMVLYGKLTEENIRNFFVNKAFIDVEGASFKRGFTVQSIEKASLLRETLAITHERIIVCPSPMFERIAFFQVGPLDIANKVLTNPNVPDQYKTYFFDNNVQLFTVFNAYKGGI